MVQTYIYIYTYIHIYMHDVQTIVSMKITESHTSDQLIRGQLIAINNNSY